MFKSSKRLSQSLILLTSSMIIIFGCSLNFLTPSVRILSKVLKFTSNNAFTVLKEVRVSDPEIKDGKKVNFIIRESGRNYFFGTDPYSYFVKYFSSQLDDSKEPVIIANNVGNFAVTSVKLIFTVKRDSFVNVTVYNLRGEVIRILKNEVMKAGKYVEAWDGRNPSGREVAAGIYFIHVTTSEYGVTKKTLFVKQ